MKTLGGDGFNGDGLPVHYVVKLFIIQKVLGVNRSVSWPVHWTSKIIQPSNIVRGTRYPGLSMGCHIDGRNGIAFGENVWVGPRVSIISMNHDLYDYEKYIQSPPVVIGDNCWIAANSVILPGVKLGNHTVVAAGSVVTNSFIEGNQVLAGVPARVVKKIENYKGSV
ncbi:MAG: acyltransferase [Neptuniibacter sp.]